MHPQSTREQGDRTVPEGVAEFYLGLCLALDGCQRFEEAGTPKGYEEHHSRDCDNRACSTCEWDAYNHELTHGEYILNSLRVATESSFLGGYKALGKEVHKLLLMMIDDFAPHATVIARALTRLMAGEGEDDACVVQVQGPSDPLPALLAGLWDLPAATAPSCITIERPGAVVTIHVRKCAAEPASR